MPNILTSYKDLLDKDIIQFDENQNATVQSLSKLFHSETNLLTKIKKLIFKERVSKGIYLWGNAGSGKTMIMDICYDSLKTNRKKRIHFQEFMIDVHDSLHLIRNNKTDKPLIKVAEIISKEIDYLFFDEFQVNDIADASILARLFNLLFNSNVFIFSTSNIIPNNLYKDGLQRDRFIPFIKLIEKDCINIELSTKKDYRKKRLKNINNYFSSLNDKTEKEIEKIFFDLTRGANLEKKSIVVKGREITVSKHAKGCARFNFDDLCGKAYGSEDYINIAKSFDIIFIENIPKLSPEKKNEVKRFIMLIDALYDNSKITVISAAGEPEDIYQKGDLEFDYKRCVSRLHEMRSKEYVESYKN